MSIKFFNLILKNYLLTGLQEFVFQKLPQVVHGRVSEVMEAKKNLSDQAIITL
jgi:hypothetical protein